MIHAVFDNSDGKLAVGADWSGRRRYSTSTRAARRLGTLDPNPAPIAERLARTQARVSELQPKADAAAAALAAATEAATKAAGEQQAAEAAVPAAQQAIDVATAAVTATTTAQQQPPHPTRRRSRPSRRSRLRTTGSWGGDCRQGRQRRVDG